jgi:Zn-dependent protease with chaperone function
MMKFRGKWYDGETSVQTPAFCIVDDDGMVRVEHEKNHDRIYSVLASKIKISSRLANTSRYLLFPGGEKFETDNNDAVDRLSEQIEYPDKMKIVHHLESRLVYIIIALLILIGILFGGMRYGIPLLAKKIAFVLPSSVHQVASVQTIEFLDRSFLRPSKLDKGIQARLLAHFQSIIRNHPDLNLKILFRKGDKIGPNAFALPDGAIIFTDEIIMASEHDDELLAVLAHETAHVLYRHGMRTIIQDSMLGFVLLFITGDVSGSSELFLGLPILLTELAYSRGFEKEADQYALSYLRSHDIDPIHFANLIKRIEKTAGGPSELSNNEWTSYLSTHPMTEKRLRSFEK